MRFQALACDYDGTLAHHGRVNEETVSALKALRRSGRKLLMVTGRRLEELFTVFSHAALFDRIVAENGALIYRPATNEEVVLAEPPAAAFIQALNDRGVTPIELGRVIVATWEPHEVAVLAAIRDLGLGMQIILNKGAVMVLPSDVSKATGMQHALSELCISPHNVASIGDAENDHALLAAAECGVAVANALEALKKRADVVTAGDHGTGVAELISQMTTDDLESWTPRLARHSITLGATADGEPMTVSAIGGRHYVAGQKMENVLNWVRTFLGGLTTAGYQWALVTDAEPSLLAEHQVVPRTGSAAPLLEEAERALDDPKLSAVIEISKVRPVDRAGFIQSLWRHWQETWQRMGRPHWIVWLDAGSMPDELELAAPAKFGVVWAHAGDRPTPAWVTESGNMSFMADGEATVQEGAGSRLAALLGSKSARAIRFQGSSSGLTFSDSGQPRTTTPPREPQVAT